MKQAIFEQIYINNTSSTSKKIEPSMLVLWSSDTIKTNRYLNKVNKITASWTEQKNILTDEKDTFTMKSLILAQDER